MVNAAAVMDYRILEPTALEKSLWRSRFRTKFTLRVHIFNVQILKEVSQESLVFISLHLGQGEKFLRTTEPRLATK